MPTPLESIQALQADVAVLHAIVHGPASGGGSTVVTEGGTVPSLAKIAADYPLSVVKTSGGGIFLQGATGSDLPLLPRVDAQIVFQAPASGTPLKTIIMGVQPNPAGEIAYTGYMQLSDSSWTQTFSLFSALVDNDNTGDYRPYIAVHGSAKIGGVSFDQTPWIVYPGHNSLRMCGGATGSSPWNNTPTPANWAEVSTNLMVGAGAILQKSGATSAFAMKSASYALNAVGFGSFGELSGTAFAQSVLIGYSTAGSVAFVTGQNLNTSAYVALQLTGSSVVLSAGASPSAAISINTSRQVQFNAYGAGSLSTDSSGNMTASDLRLKSNIGPFRRGREIVRAIDPIVFNLNSDLAANIFVVRAGFGADHFEDVFPEAVGYCPDTEDEDGKIVRGTRNLDDRALIAALWNAVRELDAATAH